MGMFPSSCRESKIGGLVAPGPEQPKRKGPSPLKAAKQYLLKLGAAPGPGVAAKRRERPQPNLSLGEPSWGLR